MLANQVDAPGRGKFPAFAEMGREFLGNFTGCVIVGSAWSFKLNLIPRCILLSLPLHSKAKKDLVCNRSTRGERILAIYDLSVRE